MKAASQLTKDIVGKIESDFAFQHAPAYVKTDCEQLKEAVDKFGIEVRDRAQASVMAAHLQAMTPLTERCKGLLKSANAFFKAHRSYGLVQPSKSAGSSSPTAAQAKAKGKAKGKPKAKASTADKLKAKAAAQANSAKAKAKARAN